MTDQKISLDNYPLDDEQDIIARSPVDFCQIVVAPPGTGKTHTVIARIVYLIDSARLKPGQLAVLCFSRTAVAEIMKRIKDLINSTETNDDLRFVSIRTFDSFATRLLMAGDPDRDLSKAGYDKRIQMAVDALKRTGSEESKIISQYRHLIVDEIQDLEGVRSQLVTEIVQRISGGFTFLGDPAQAIYGFTRDQNRRLDAATLLDWVKKQTWINELAERNLTINYRSSGRTAELADRARSIIQNGDSKNNESAEELRGLLKNLKSAGTGKATEKDLLESKYDTVCILCRTNGELLQIGSMLAQQEIDFYIKPRAEEYALPPWIGRTVGNCDSNRISEDGFLDLWKEFISNKSGISPADAYRWLKRVEGRETVDLDLERLHRNLYKGYRLPDEADAGLINGDRKLTLSTIHASKGREYDHVVILQPEDSDIATRKSDEMEEARILYVAATRAREELSNMARDGIPENMWVLKCNEDRRRWVSIIGYGKNAYLEVGLPGDIDPCSHVSYYVHKRDSDVVESQNMIWENMGPGYPLYIHKVRRGNYTFFNIQPHKGTGLPSKDIAQLSLNFKRDLGMAIKRLTESDKFYYPNYWVTAKVSRLVTEVLPVYPENVHQPYRKSGFCLGIRLRGMVRIPLER